MRHYVAMEIRRDCEGLEERHLEPFFVGWPSPPTLARRLEILLAAHHVALAWREDALLGFATALSDGTFAAFIPLLEVTPDRQGQGIGRALVRDLLEQLPGHYSIDLVCDPDVSGFYEPLGFQRLVGMGIRRYDCLDGSAQMPT